MGLMLNRPGVANKPPLPTPRIIPKATAEFEQVVKEETHEADRVIAEADAILDKTPAESPIVIREENISGEEDKLNRLIDDDFPFDDTQLTAIYGLAQQQYGVMIGAAGTGKTTTTKKLVDILSHALAMIDVSKYWQRGEIKEGDEDYETPERLIPSICMVSFTGRATQMIKKNFPRDWHPNIMTIHRALGFYPEFYQDFDGESNEMVNKRRFVPAYNEDNLMPWDIILIDEAGMLGLELWHQLWAACKPGCRIYMIGDINQLPPTHGKSVLGFALANWPTWELTHVHRQQGANNSIVDNAHRILKGLRPVSDSPEPLSLRTPEQMLKALNFMASDADWRFITVEVPEDHRQASQRIRQCMQLLQGKLYEPNRDVVITPINGYEQTAPGYTLGQAPMNQELVVKLNSKNPRYIIDAGREKQNFAVGDKVMATVNDYEAGITNGMTGVVKEITENGGYIGDTRRWGLITEVNEYLSGLVSEEDDDVEFSLEDMVNDSQAGLEESRKKEKRDAGPASHIVEVEFGEGEHAFSIAFSTKSTVASLMLAYVATCHKMQGGECPHVFGIVHQANKRPLNREWFYTMVTRAAQKCVVFTTRQGLGFALGKQNIKGATLEAKVKTFIALTASGLVGPSVRVKLPQRRGLGTELTPYQPKEIVSAESKTSIPADPQSDGQGESLPTTRNDDGRKGLAESLKPQRPPIQPDEPSRSEESQKAKLDESPMGPSIRVGALHIHIHESPNSGRGTSGDKRSVRHRVGSVDGGDLHPHPQPTGGRSDRREIDGNENRDTQSTQLEPSPQIKALTWIPNERVHSRRMYEWAQKFDADFIAPTRILLLPKPIKVVPPKPLSIGALLARGKAK
jgi:ATP-dependent exoDNAse (exonuclease V) alpha subunit